MSEYEEGHIHFTVTEFAKLCEELGFHQILPLLLYNIRLKRCISSDIQHLEQALEAFEELVTPVGKEYVKQVNAKLEDAEEDDSENDVLIKVDSKTGKQIH